MMKKHIALILVATISSTAFARDADIAEQQARELGEMDYINQKLKIQAEMAESYKKMESAGFIVDKDGNPIGVKNIQELGNQVRTTATTKPASGIGQNPMGFDFNQQQPGMPVQQPQQVASQPKDDKEETSGVVKLVEVRGDSIVVNSSAGKQELRQGQKVGDLTLKRFARNRAYFTKPDGSTLILEIKW